MEELRSRHAREEKELQGRLTQKKKNATKKTRKGINDECDRLQRELDDRQRQELVATGETSVSAGELALSFNKVAITTGEMTDGMSTPEIQDEKPAEAGNESGEPILPMSNQTKKPNRQKARLARRAAEQEAQAEEASKEADDMPDLRQQELAKMQALLTVHGLKEVSIRPDGHCLYSAVALLLADHPSQTRNHSLSYQEVRASTADFITSHSDDFEAFLEESIAQYTSKIRGTAEWGGQLELQAMVRFYGIPIHVLQADGSVEKILPDEKTDVDPIWLAYYRHSFGLGEHYNALRLAP